MTAILFKAGDEMPDQVNKRNTALFNKIADILEFTPKLHDQGTWGEFRPSKRQETAMLKRVEDGRLDEELSENDGRWRTIGEKGCDTTLCVAGHAAALSGYYPTAHTWQTENGPMTRLSWGEVSKDFDAENGEDITTVGMRVLGITLNEASALFGASRELTPQDLRDYGAGKPII